MRSVRVFRALLLIGSVTFANLASFNSYAQPAQMTAQQFQANPGQILKDFPDGGALMASFVRQLALADQADLPLIIGLLSNSNPDQTKAIGTGLGQAALASVTNNPTYASEIQTELVAANNGPAALAFAGVMGDQQIGATTGGGGGGGGGGGPTNQPGGGGSAGFNTLILNTSATNTPTSGSSSSSTVSSASVSAH